MRTLWVAVSATALVATGCTSPALDEEPMAATVTFKDQWASSADSGMAAVFGTLTNSGHHDARIVSGSSPLAARMEVHEVVPDTDGTKTMRPKARGLTVPAGGTHDLVPGGDHLMLMDLTEPLQPGADIALTVAFEDGSTLPVTAQVRDFAGADEEYRG
ncbi:copper chaperone PCu(A)C [Mycobacterium deserti]|uniref:Copper chaperone PCu(A)C n=1 Tax=Mycobacterium deserti TaxID=2978347 RepID=A0ABT2M650_9MYCO|nr:copper chaperone PCu(A)C [Mycobacterium deserti]MCT7657738.1 copper chaperone PCu(A)C [Mycobacterium deserti]